MISADGICGLGGGVSGQRQLAGQFASRQLKRLILGQGSGEGPFVQGCRYWHGGRGLASPDSLANGLGVRLGRRALRRRQVSPQSLDNGARASLTRRLAAFAISRATLSLRLMIKLA